MGLSFSEDWGAIQSAFDRMFNGLGEVHIDDGLLQYRSTPPSVSTGISITKEGVLVANMPLHNIQSTFTQIIYQEEGLSLTLEGPDSRYTYTVPSEILALRSI
jgi:hypothetical protein